MIEGKKFQHGDDLLQRLVPYFAGFSGSSTFLIIFPHCNAIASTLKSFVYIIYRVKAARDGDPVFQAH